MVSSIKKYIRRNARKITKKAPSLTITLNDERYRNSKKPLIYQPMEVVQGQVVVKAEQDTSFDTVEIALIGRGKVFRDPQSSLLPQREGRVHRFLTMMQPLVDLDPHAPKAFLAGRTYRFPFFFTIPARLLDSACPHPVSSQAVRISHLNLPPTLGRSELTASGLPSLDAIASSVATVSYQISVRVTQNDKCGASKAILAEEALGIHIRSLTQEEPPAFTEMEFGTPCLSHNQTVRDFWQSPVGTLIGQCSPPRTINLTQGVGVGSQVASTDIRVTLEFRPSEGGSVPITLRSMNLTMIASTFYALEPQQDFPPESRNLVTSHGAQNVVEDIISLSPVDLKRVVWKRTSPGPYPIGHEDASNCGGSSIRLENCFIKDILTAEISVPVTLRCGQLIQPTFHSCLISRTYSLSMKLLARESGSTKPILNLQVPVHIAIDRNNTFDTLRGQSMSGPSSSAGNILADQVSPPPYTLRSK